MSMIKEFCPSSSRGVIRERNYDNRFSKFQALVQEAKSDFPYLTDEDIEIVHYGGGSYSGTWGIEFPAHGVPNDYEVTAQLELTL